jgi:hypothetical protein
MLVLTTIGGGGGGGANAVGVNATYGVQWW